MPKEDPKPKGPTKTLRLVLVVSCVLLLVSLLAFIAYQLVSGDKEVEEKTSDIKSADVVVGVSLGPLRTERWQKDVDLMVEYGEEKNVYVNVLNANEDPDLQMTQAESLILQGVDVLIIIPIDGEKIAPIVDIAHEAGIKVIAYDRMISHPDLDYYVSFDSFKVGEYQAQGVFDEVPKGKYIYLGGSPTDNNAYLLKEGSFSVIQPAIDRGDIELVMDVFVENWKTELAYQKVYDYLASGKKLDAIISANDGMADGAVKALKEFNLAGKVPISGQDAELTACQRVAEGTQTLTVYKPLSSLAKRAIIMAVEAANGDVVETTGTILSPLNVEIPSYLLESTPVYKDNLESTVIKDGFHKSEEIYKSLPKN